MSGVDEEARRVQKEFEGTMGRLEQSYLRPLQAVFHRCAVTCCDDKKSSTEQFHSCMGRCERPMKQAHGVVEQEIQTFQNRFTRCMENCQDEAKLRASPGEQVDLASPGVESCMVACCKSTISLLADFEKRLVDNLKKFK